MSQILSATPPLEALIMQMIQNGSSTSSGSFYNFELSDDSTFEVKLLSGSSISISPSTDVILLKKGLYQLSMSGAIRTGSNSIYGLSQTTLQISIDPTFTDVTLGNDQANQWYGNGTDENTPLFFDMNHTVVFNITDDDTPLAIRMRNTNETSADFFIAGSNTFPLTTLQLVRLGGALS